MLVTASPAFVLVLLGASTFPKSKSFAAKEQQQFAGSHALIRKYFRECMTLDEKSICDLFDSPLEPAQQLARIEKFIQEQDHSRVQRIFLYYVGHGIDVPTATSNQYVLACATTEDDVPLRTSIDLLQVAEALDRVASKKDLMLLLDCCFAAQAVSRLKERGRNIGCLAAASSTNAALAPPGANRTQFADCLYESLMQGLKEGGARLSLLEVCSLIRKQVDLRYPAERVYPETHAPTQKTGNPLEVPIFPNAAFSAKPAVRADEPYLLIQVEPKSRRTPQPRYCAKAWLMDGIDAAGKPVGDLIWDTEAEGERGEKFLTKDQLGSLLLALKKSAADSLQRKGSLTTDFWIELVVPRELLSEPFDQHPTTYGTLGMEHPVVVRSLERLRGAHGAEPAADGRTRIRIRRLQRPNDPADAGSFDAEVAQRQKKRWHQLLQQAQVLCPPLIPLQHEDPPAPATGAMGAWVNEQCKPDPRLWDRLIHSPGESLICAVLDKAPAAAPSTLQQDTFHALLIAGIPVMLWSRDPQAHSAQQQPLQQLMSQGRWGDIPNRVRNARREAAIWTEPHYGAQLTLLWDDPTRIPPRPDRLVDPPLRNRNDHG